MGSDVSPGVVGSDFGSGVGPGVGSDGVGSDMDFEVRLGVGSDGVGSDLGSGIGLGAALHAVGSDGNKIARRRIWVCIHLLFSLYDTVCLKRWLRLIPESIPRLNPAFRF